MIIKREYVNIGYLIEKDKEANEIIRHALRELSAEEREEIIAYNSWNILHEVDIGSGLMHFDEIKAGMDRLDREKPFENGMTYANVNNVITIPDDTENKIIMVLEWIVDGTTNIVQVLEVTNENGRTMVNDDPDDVPLWRF